MNNKIYKKIIIQLNYIVNFFNIIIIILNYYKYKNYFKK